MRCCEKIKISTKVIDIGYASGAGVLFAMEELNPKLGHGFIAYVMPYVT